MTTYAGQSIFGRTSFDDFGAALDGIGDLNGDGFMDYAVGARSEFDSTDAGFTSGAVYVVFGTAEGPATLDADALDGTNGFRITASDTSRGAYAFGSFVGGLGDVNGDGVDDLIVGEASSRYGGYGSTERDNGVFVVFGRTSGFDAGLDVDSEGAGSVLQIQNADGLLTTVGSAGDLNGDGFDDILIGQSPVPLNGGGFLPIDLTATDGAAPKPVPGAALQPGGEYNGYVILGGETLDDEASLSVLDLDGTNGFGVAGPRGVVSGGIEGGIYGQYGGGLVNLGDVNGDGFSDLFIQNVQGSVVDYGEPYNPYDDILDFTTTQYILFGSDSGFSDIIDPAAGASEVLEVDWRNLEFSSFFRGGTTVTNAETPQGFASSDQRYSIAGIGDINGDGFDDVAIGDASLISVGAPDSPDRVDFYGGPVHILYGSASGPVNFVDITGPASPDEGFTLIDSSDNGFGAVVSGAGDIDGDGIDDILITSDFGEMVTLVLGRDAAGAAPAFEGIVDTVDLDLEADAGIYRFAELSDDFTNFGSALSAAGDVDGDGFDDFLIGARDFDVQSGATTISSAGAAFLVKGGLANLEAADQADGTDDNVINILNLDVDVDTGLVPIDVTISESFGLGVIQNEGDAGTTDFTFTLNRTGDLSLGLTVDFAVTGSGFNAADAADFDGGALPSGQAVFASGSDTATITVAVAGDLDIESNEDFRVSLSNAVVLGGGIVPPVNLIDQVAFGRILNDEFPPEIRLSRSFYSNVEGDPGDAGGPNNITFVIERLGNTAEAAGEVEVFYELTPGTNGRALLNADSADIVGTLPSGVQSVIIAAGASQAEVVVEIQPDFLQEPREEFNFAIVDIDDRGAGVDFALTQTTARGVIINDDGRPVVIPDGGEADVFGDPHIVTLDGLGYDFQAVGEYVLVESTPGAANPFSVQVRFEPLEGSELVSVTTRMAVEIGGSTVEIDALTGGTLLIDGVAVDPLDPASAALLNLFGDEQPDILFDGEMYTLILNETDGGETEVLQVKAMDGVLNICVFLSSDAGGNAGGVRGLMGNNNGTLGDDFALRDGSVIPASELTLDADGVPTLSFDFLYGRGAFDGAGYAGSWEIEAGERLFSDTAPAFPDSFPVGVVSLDDLPDDVVANAIQAALEAGVDPLDEAIFNAAVLDFALTGNENFLIGALGLAAQPEAETEPDLAPELPVSFAVTAGEAEIVEQDDGSTTLTFSVFSIGEVTADTDVTLSFSGVDADDLASPSDLTQTVTFTAGGADSQFVTIDIAGDGLVETDELLTLEITEISDATALIASGTASTLILNDDNAPVAEDDTASGDEDTLITILASDVLSNDSDADGDALTITAVVASGNGTASVNASGDIEFDPDANFFGTVELTYTVSDGTQDDEGLITLEVNPVNDAPAAEDDDTGLVVAAGSSVTITADSLLSNDSDVDGDTLSLTGVDSVVGGTAEINGDGDVVFTADAAFDGEASFEYSITDDLEEASATASLTVEADGDPVNVIEAGSGAETLEGTDEVDVFVFEQGDSNLFGIDDVDNFEAGDQLDLSAFGFDNIFTGGSGQTDDSIVLLGGDGSVILISARGFTDFIVRVDGTVEDVIAGIALTDEDSFA